MPRLPAVDASSQLDLFESLPAAAPAPSAGPAEAPSRAAEPPAAPQTQANFRHPQATREARLNGHLVAYHFRRARRKSIGFVVGTEGLTVSAPRWVGLAEIESALQEKSRWILAKLQEQHERARRLQTARVDWCDGTTIPFLGETVIVVLDPRSTGAVLHDGPQLASLASPEGRQHGLGRPGAVLHDDPQLASLASPEGRQHGLGRPGAVLHSAGDTLPGVPRLTLHVGLPHTASAEQIRDAVQSWLQRQAKRIFDERCRHFAAQLGVRMTRLTLSSASTRWGSAGADGAIRLNWRLVHFAMPSIDYVVAHELAHLREMNHSAAFWEVVRSVVPDYQAARGTLRDDALPVFD